MERILTPSFPIRLALACTILATAAPAGAQMYKWTDDRGVVSYSNTPPPPAAQRKVEAVEDRVSVYTTDEETKRAIAADKKREARAPTLGSQLGTQRTRPARDTRETDQANRQAAAYQRCVDQRRVDCENLRSSSSGGVAAMDYGSGYGVGDGYVFLPQHVIGAIPVRPTPFVVGESPIPRIGISTAPPVGISTTPPVGAPPRTRTTGSFR